MRPARLVLAGTIVGALALTGAGSGADATATAGPCLGQIRSLGSGWQALTPDFRFGPHRVTQAEAVGYAPDRFWATNGTEVVRTDDAGCHWIGYIVPAGGSVGLPVDLPDPLGGLLRIPTTTHVTTLAVPSSASSSAWVYAGLSDESTINDQPSIAWFDGSSWHWRESNGLPSSGRVTQIAASATTQTIAYAVVDPASALSQGAGLYATNNGGQSWTLVNGAIRSADLQELKVDPVVPTTVYGLSSDGVRISYDGGRNFVASGRPGRDIASYDVAAGGGGSHLVQGHTSSKTFDRSDDTGKTWSAESSPVTADTVAMQPVIDQVAVSDGNSVWLRLARAPGCPTRRDITPPGGAPETLQVSAPLTAGYAVSGVRGSEILRGVFSLKCGRAVLLSGSKPIRLLPGATPQYFPASFLPTTTSLSLRAGGVRDVPYRLLLPRRPSPVDVMFLVDTSDSTAPTIEGLKQDLGAIVNDLTEARFDVQFGVAHFEDYPPNIDDRGAGEKGDVPYWLDRAIGPADQQLSQALQALHQHGGGDPPESQLTALYQSTTGAGQRWPGKNAPQTWIPGLAPGNDAGYRPDALKLAVLATDDRFHHEHSYLTPSWTQTVSALRTHGVHFIGLAVRKTNGDEVFGYRALKPEQQFASDVGSLAPAGGVDCNGDLVPDVAAGAPFVCKVNAVLDHTVNVGPVQAGDATVEPVKLAPAISAAVQGIVDVQPVTLQLSAPPSVAHVVNPTVVPQVNLKADNTVNFTVQYACPRSKRAHTYPVTVNALAGGQPVTSTHLRLACAALPVKPPAPSHHVPVAAAAAPAVIPRAPAPPPAPPAPGNPIPNPNPNPNPNPAMNANVGFASQEEEQRQLAFAGADAGVAEDTGEELAMSRLGIGAGVLLAMSAGWVARRRLADRTRYAYAWHRR